MNLTWMKSVLSGTAEWSLADIHLSNGQGIDCKGQGVLRWSREKGASIEAFTDGAKGLMRLFGDTPCAPGELYPADWYLRLDGTTQTGEKVAIERIVPDGYTIAGVDKPAFWSIPEKDIASAIDFIDAQGLKAKETQSEILITPNNVRPWRRGSTITDDNPRFGGQQNKLDWLQFEFGQGEVALRAHGALVRAKIKHKSDEIARAHFAINLALSFAFGRLNRIEAIHQWSPDGGRGQLPLPGRLSSGRFPSPIGGLDAIDSEGLLAACADLFMTSGCDSPPLSDSGGGRIMVPEGVPKDERIAGRRPSLASV